MKLSEFLSDVGRPVAFYPTLVKAFGDRNEAIFICQMAYWRGKGESEDGWIYKTSDEIEAETSLTYKEQTNVRNGLKKKELLKEKHVRTEHKMYFRVDWDKVNSLWGQFTDGKVVHITKSKLPPSPKKGGSLPVGISLNSNTENTAENTTKIKTSVEKPAKPPTPPEVKLFREATGRYPARSSFTTVVDAIQKIGKRLGRDVICDDLKPFLTDWTDRGWNPMNLAWLKEWAVFGAIPTNGKNPAAQPRQASNRAALAAMKFDDEGNLI